LAKHFKAVVLKEIKELVEILGYLRA